jgi:hypothetical protein
MSRRGAGTAVMKVKMLDIGELEAPACRRATTAAFLLCSSIRR